MRMDFNQGYFDGEVSDNGDFIGKIVYNNGDVFDGKIIGGEFSGKVKKMYSYGIYEGEWSSGEKNGFGTMTWSDGDTYTGEWKDGVMSGKGTFNWTNGDTYTGEWKYGKIDGKGKMKWGKYEWYDGEWKDGDRHGMGVYRNPNGNLFEETFVNGVRQTSIRIENK